MKELTQEEKNFMLEVLTKVGLDYEASKIREVVMSKLQMPPLATIK